MRIYIAIHSGLRSTTEFFGVGSTGFYQAV